MSSSVASSFRSYSFLSEEERQDADITWWVCGSDRQDDESSSEDSEYDVNSQLSDEVVNHWSCTDFFRCNKDKVSNRRYHLTKKYKQYAASSYFDKDRVSDRRYHLTKKYKQYAASGHLDSPRSGSRKHKSSPRKCGHRRKTERKLKQLEDLVGSGAQEDANCLLDRTDTNEECFEQISKKTSSVQAQTKITEQTKTNEYSDVNAETDLVQANVPDQMNAYETTHVNIPEQANTNETTHVSVPEQTHTNETTHVSVLQQTNTNEVAIVPEQTHTNETIPVNVPEQTNTNEVADGASQYGATQHLFDPIDQLRGGKNKLPLAYLNVLKKLEEVTLKRQKEEAEYAELISRSDQRRSNHKPSENIPAASRKNSTRASGTALRPLDDERPLKLTDSADHLVMSADCNDTNTKRDDAPKIEVVEKRRSNKLIQAFRVWQGSK